MGSPLAGQELIIAGRNGSPAREREVGEILIKSPSLMRGYYHNQEETDKVIQDGWLRTGDLGFVHRGRLFITGRAKEMIIKRGRNYYPYDIERAASSVKGVRKGCLAAFAIPNGETGTEDLVLNPLNTGLGNANIQPVEGNTIAVLNDPAGDPLGRVDLGNARADETLLGDALAHASPPLSAASSSAALRIASWIFT